MTLQETRDEAKQKGVEYKSKDTIAQIRKAIDAKEAKDKLKKGEVSPEQIQTWKSQYKEITKISVRVSENEILVGYLHNPKRDHLAIALSLYSQHKTLECGEFLRDNCWLGGDERLKTTEGIAESAAIQANTIVNFFREQLNKSLELVPEINEREGIDFIEKVNGLLSYHFNIPFPEELDDLTYYRKFRQLIWVLSWESKRSNLKEKEKIGI